MQNQETQADNYSEDSASPEEEVIQKISPDPSSFHSTDHKSTCRCDCHPVRKSNKAYAIIPIKQNGHIINIVKVPLYKMEKQPNKTFAGYCKYRTVPNDPNRQNHYQLSVWQLNQSEISSCVDCSAFKPPCIRLYADAVCQTEEPEVHITLPAEEPKQKEEPKKTSRRRSGDQVKQRSNNKWESYFVNDKSYTRKRSDG